ncbi:MAG: carboxylating nicotinate-nucleotide diphosphorylase [Myxococcota bacterium]|nr:carboxylating nicotinate-nucleotide diphosphorylase [Myxococcota bacterium]
MTLEELVRQSLIEDVGPGDVTTNSCVPASSRSEAWIEARQSLVVSGLQPAAEVFRQMGVNFVPLVEDGERVCPLQKVAEISGSSRSILTGERLALNFLMRLSGIATHTAIAVDAAAGQIEVVDTRKTTPLHRKLEKDAVLHGGAKNHRFALYDAVLIKDNHIRAAGGVGAAIENARAAAPSLRIQCEVENLRELEEAIAAGAQSVLLDNMSNEELAACVQVAASRVETEASGGMTAERISGLVGIGLDRVSVGGLIHQARWVDFSLQFAGRDG